MDERTEAPSSDLLPDKVNDYRIKVENALVAEVQRHKESIYFTSLANALKGGKRIRPIVLMLSFESVGGQETNPLPAAVAVELVHTESLIHDDMIDKDALRRGQTAYHSAHGYAMALLSADFVLSMILDLTAQYMDPRITRALAQAIARMSEGELEERLALKSKQTLSSEEYLQIISKKTASLFEVSARLGAILGGGREEEITALSEYGRLFGIAYQIRDDVIDSEKRPVTNVLSLLDTNTEKVTALHTMGEAYVLKAKQALTELGKSRAQGLLIELAEAIISPSMSGLSNQK
jgi:octaprenyl-diphosphate synthase